MKPLFERPTTKQVYFDWLREHSTKEGAMSRHQLTKPEVKSRQLLEKEYFTSFMAKAILGADQLKQAFEEGAAGSASRPDFVKKTTNRN